MRDISLDASCTSYVRDESMLVRTEPRVLRFSATTTEISLTIPVMKFSYES